MYVAREAWLALLYLYSLIRSRVVNERANRPQNERMDFFRKRFFLRQHCVQYQTK